MLYDQYVTARIPIDLRLRARAALNVSPAGACISHHTAAAIWGAVPPATSAVHVRQSTASGRSVRQGVQAHYRRLAPATTTRHGLPITTPEQTFLDLAAAGLPLVELVIVGDGLVKTRATSVERLLAAASEATGHGHRLARRAATLVREGVDSPEDTRQWVTDIDRREELDRGGYRLVVVTREGIYVEPERTLERVRDALTDCGAPGVPRRFSPEWRRHFG